MMNKTLKKGTAIALSGMMIFSSMGLVYADSQTAVKSTLQNETSTSTTKSDHNFKGRMGGKDGIGEMRGQHTNPMDALIKAGTITQTQADSLKTALDAGRESKTTFADVLKNLVTAGTLTQEQADAITKAMPTPPAKDVNGDFKGRINPMTTLVTAGTLTQTEADAVKAALDAGRESKTTFADVLKNLVSAGTLTQEKADAITKAMPTPPAKDLNGSSKGDFKGRVNPMTALVTAGTLTQTQADAIETALKTAHDSKTAPVDVFKTLVTNGTLTQAQADALTTAMTPHHQ